MTYTEGKGELGLGRTEMMYLHLLMKSFQYSYLCKYPWPFLATVTLVCVCVLVPQLCPTLCDPMGCCWPGASVHGILKARILEWIAISFSRGSSQPRD